MAKGIEVAQAYVTITPSMEGIQKTISNELVPAASKAGDDAGKAAGEGIEEGAAKGSEGLGESLRKGAGRASDDVAQEVQSKLSAKFSEIGSRISGRFQAIGQGISGTFQRVGSAISGSAFGQALSGVADRARSAFDRVSGTIRGVGGFITETMGGVASRVGEAFSPVAERLSGAFGAARDKIGPILSDIAAKAADAAKMAARIIGAAIGAGAIAIGKMALDAYADFEQLEGGVQTLFGDAADEVMANAARAYDTAGVSANQYMELATETSAAMVSALGGDVERAAELTDQSIIDMADNANKMGSDLSSIQDAYRGFSRGNFTMLDNLKLGYGGTREEMERLLADAEAISGVHYDIDSYADITEAIHVMQESMGIAGTTFEEGTDTISGSINRMQAAWTNWLAGLGNEDADLGALTDQLIESVATAAGNVVPRLGIIGERLIAALPGVFDEVAAAVPGMLGVIGDKVNEALGTNIDLAGAFGSAMASLQATLSGPISFLQARFSDLAAAIGPLVETWGPLLADAFTNVVAPAVTVVAGVLVGLVTHAVEVATAIGGAVGDVIGWFQQLPSNVSSALNTVKSTVTSIFNTVKNTVSGAVNGAKSAVSTALDAIKGAFSTAKGAISGAVDGVKGVIGGIGDKIQGVKDKVTGAIDKIKSVINGAKLELPHFKVPHFNISGGKIPWGIGGQGTKPTISVEWYATGGIFDAPSVIGVGERGPEAVVPLSDTRLMRPLVEEIADESGDAEALITWLSRYLGPTIAEYAPQMSRRDFARQVRSYA